MCLSVCVVKVGRTFDLEGLLLKVVMNCQMDSHVVILKYNLKLYGMQPFISLCIAML